VNRSKLHKEKALVNNFQSLNHARSIPPKHAVAQVIGCMKGKSATWIAHTCGRRKNFIAQNFWARGYYVTTTGLDEETVRDYIKEQEDKDKLSLITWLHVASDETRIKRNARDIID